MITTVTLNPAIDRTIAVNGLTAGKINKICSSREDMGGKGINVARILQSLGSEAMATGFIGARNFDHVNNLLERDGIVFDLVKIDAETRQNIKLVDSQAKNTTDLNEAGFSVGAHDLAELKTKIRHYADSSEFVVMSGSLPRGLSNNIYYELIAMLPADCKTVLDADGEVLLKGLTAHPYLIKPNIHELENALGRTLPTHGDIVVAARDLIDQHAIAYALISMGGEGSILVSRQQALYAAALPVQVKSTVGAGDTMLAGFIHSLATGQSDLAALACATACGALAVSKEGTEAISKSEMTVLSSQVKVSLINI